MDIIHDFVYMYLVINNYVHTYTYVYYIVVCE